MPNLRPEEEWVRRALEAALGAPVVQHDDGSMPGMHDPDIVRSGRRDAVEVTAAADAAAIELWRLVNDSDDTWTVEASAGGWMVWLRPDARAKRILAELPAVLLEMERQGEREFRADWRPSLLSSSSSRQLLELKVTSARQGGTSRPGSVYLSIELPPERSGGVVDPECHAVPGWVSEFLSGDGCRDVRGKLLRSGAAERHASVILPSFTTAPFAVTDALFRESGVPEQPPALPDEITHVWLASGWNTGSGLRWSPDAGWERFQHLVESVQPAAEEGA